MLSDEPYKPCLKSGLPGTDGKIPVDLSWARISKSPRAGELSSFEKHIANPDIVGLW